MLYPWTTGTAALTQRTQSTPTGHPADGVRGRSELVRILATVAHLWSDARMAEPIKLEMSLEEAMLTQRAIRRLKPDPVDDALVLKLIELALKAPTGSNAQNWESA